MTIARHPDDIPARHSVRVATVALLCALVALSGCNGMWEALRRSEQRMAANRARTLEQKGDCEAALESLERAQGVAELGAFAAESTWLKARCLERMDRHQEALAHWRLLVDFFPESRYAQRVDASVRAEPGDPDANPIRGPAPRALSIAQPRYSHTARRSHLTGSVVLTYRIRSAGEVDEIRVIELAHVLLASWAIEAIARAEWHSKHARELELPLWATSSFRFEHIWAEPDGNDAAADASP
jgi:tetratricopeptide (TPR) repeat protein